MTSITSSLASRSFCLQTPPFELKPSPVTTTTLVITIPLLFVIQLSHHHYCGSPAPPPPRLIIVILIKEVKISLILTNMRRGVGEGWLAASLLIPKLRTQWHSTFSYLRSSPYREWSNWMDFTSCKAKEIHHQRHTRWTNTDANRGE